MPIAPDGTPLPYPEDMMMGTPMAGGAPPAPSGPDAIREMLSLAAAYADTEQDEEDLLTLEKARTLLQQLLAKQQKEQDGLMQGKVSPAALRRASVG